MKGKVKEGGKVRVRAGKKGERKKGHKLNPFLQLKKKNKLCYNPIAINPNTKIRKIN